MRKKPTFDFESRTWDDGRPVPDVPWADNDRPCPPISAPRARKHRPAWSTLTFGRGARCARPELTRFPRAALGPDDAERASWRENLTAVPRVTAASARRAAAYGSLDDAVGTGPESAP